METGPGQVTELTPVHDAERQGGEPFWTSLASDFLYKAALNAVKEEVSIL